jgi:aminopeptidase YwaD
VGVSDKKLVLCANFDTRYNSTGAFDNASGTCALLTITEILAKKNLNCGLELIAFNDEEYTAKGAVAYLEKYRNTFPKILSAINLDGVGNRAGVNCMTSFETNSDINALIDNLLKKYTDIKRVDPWYSEDHTIFLLCNVPTLSFSSVDFPPIVHTQWDNIEWVDPQKVHRVISFVLDYVDQVVDVNAKKQELVKTKA